MIIQRTQINLLEKIASKVDWSGDINYIEILPSDMSVDDNELGVAGGNVNNVFDCFDFEFEETGSIWFNFKYPYKWLMDRDIIFDLYYVLDGYDYGKQVILNSSLWIMNLGVCSDEHRPTITGNDLVFSGPTNVNKLAKHNALGMTIPKNTIPSTDSLIAVKLTRNITTDTYNGHFKLLRIIGRQL
jgi:hypothetical protein